MTTKLQILTYAAAVSAVLLTGCQYPNGEPNNTGTGALVGGGIGAASGALLGGRNGAAGALIGGAIGAVAGGLIGNSMDQEQRERLREEAPQTYVRIDQGQPLSPADIKALVKANVSDDVIISQIQASHTVFHLSSSDIVDLHQSGVSDRVIDFMINTQSSVSVQTGTTVVQQSPPAPPAQTVVVSPGPGYVWVDGEWAWNGVTWVWAPGYWAYPPYPRAVWVHGYWHHGPYGWYHSPGRWR